MVEDKKEFLFNEACDMRCCESLFDFQLPEGTYDLDDHWDGQCMHIEFSEEDLDQAWERIWEQYGQDLDWQFYAKDKIWHVEDLFGDQPRQILLKHIKHMQGLITPPHWEEINHRKEKVHSSLSAFKKSRQKFEEESALGKFDNLSKNEITTIKPVWRHNNEYKNPTREVEYICDDLWKHLDHEEIFIRVEKERGKYFPEGINRFP